MVDCAAWLKEMDRARYEDPERVLKDLEGRRATVPPPNQPLYFGVLGSTYRLLAGRSQRSEPCLKQAEVHIEFSRWIAKRRGDTSAEVDLHLRSSYVMADRGDFRLALARAEHANALSERCQDIVGRGRSLFEQGKNLYYLQRTPEAIQAYRAALRLLPESEQANVFSAHQALGLCFKRQKHHGKALEHAREAEKLTPSPWFEAKLCWLKAQLYEGLADLSQAETQFSRAAEIFSDLHYGEAALATVELVRIQVLQGKAEEAAATVRGIVELIVPLGNNQVVAGAIVGLLRGSLTLDSVENARSQIETARECPKWHSLEVGP